MDTSINENLSDAPKYRIGAVTKLTGLSADVVRVWERRYGAVRPLRSQGGSRLYSDADIMRLRQLRQAIDKGHSIGQVANLPGEELEHLIGDSRQRADVTDPYTAVRERFLEAIGKMDVVTADAELSRAATLFPARPLIKNIIAPILTEIGERWSHRELGVAHEHVASNLVRGLLGSLIRLYPPNEHSEPLVLATPAGERHEFGLLLAALLAASRGWRVIYLGADLPAAETAHALRLSGARYLALSLLTPHDGQIAKDIEELASLVGPAARVWVGGSGTQEYTEIIERAGWIIIRDLDDLDD
ncbi:MAG TPA: MerR family transcriptional regulator, partial [Blastocatellia bacterium]|nr:MerR family transcriptional regulator [Blastocatellia bacterium]